MLDPERGKRVRQERKDLLRFLETQKNPFQVPDPVAKKAVKNSGTGKRNR